MKKTYLLLGTNLGDRKRNLEQAIELLEVKGLKIKGRSSIYETAAWGFVDQPSFYNQALEAMTDYSPKELLLIVKSVENEMGRIKKEKWQERLIDIDILFYNDMIVNDEHLVIPHPEMQNRKFALIPLVELTANQIHPVLRKTTMELLDECEDKLEVKLVK
jgi:2-amino-4-hydroxy-6-hydroxymethyldihydropteridine diphosphokinase